MHVVLNRTEVMHGGFCDLSYDLIVLDESARLLSHFDEGTVNKTEVELWVCSFGSQAR